MSNSIALLALEAADGTVVLTSITLVSRRACKLCACKPFGEINPTF